MPQTTGRAEWTFRTDGTHRDVIDELASRRGLTRQHFMTLLESTALGLPRPARTPALPLDLEEIRREAQAIYEELTQEVLPETA